MRGDTARGVMLALWFGASVPASGVGAYETCDQNLPDILANQETQEIVFGKYAHRFNTGGMKPQEMEAFVSRYLQGKERAYEALFSCDGTNDEINIMAQALKKRGLSLEQAEEIFDKMLNALAGHRLEAIMELYPAEEFVAYADGVWDLFIDHFVSKMNVYTPLDLGIVNRMRDLERGREEVGKKIRDKVRAEHKKLALFALKADLAEIFDIVGRTAPDMPLEAYTMLEEIDDIHEKELPLAMQNVTGQIVWIMYEEIVAYLEKQKDMDHDRGKYKSAGAEGGSSEEPEFAAL